MRLDTRGLKGELFNNHALSIGELPVGAFLGKFSLADDERKDMIEVCEKIWKDLRKKRQNSKTKEIKGLCRFDLIPEVNQSNAKKGCIGQLKIVGAYEVNCDSPECLAAGSAMRAALPNISCVNAAAIVADRVKEIFGEEEIAFVVGETPLKQSWYPFLVKDLIEAGLRIKVMSPMEVMTRKPPLIWRWGDTSFEGKGQYPEWFNNWLYNQKESIVFNEVLHPSEDMADKSLLLSSDDPFVSKLLGDNRSLTEESIWWSVDQLLERKKRQVLKPDKGASGKDVFFSQKYQVTEWIELLREKCKEKRKFSIWEFKPLPKINILGKALAFDINAAVLVDGDKIEYLYSIIRLDKYNRYRERLKMNVAGGNGAGVAGLIV